MISILSVSGRRPPPLLTALIVLAALAAPAQATGNPPILANGVLGIVLSRGLVTFPLHAGMWQFKVAPSYVTQKDDREGQSIDMDGWGVGLAATRALSDHWGINLIAGYEETSGVRHLTTNYSQGDSDSTGPVFATTRITNDTVNGQPGETRGYALLVNLMWDAWSGDGFRMPLYLGTGFMYAHGEVAAATGLKREGTTSSPVITFGINPSFPVRDFRFGAYFLLSGPFSGGKGKFSEYDPATGVVSRQLEFDITDDPLESGAAIMGVEASYLPWGFSVGWIPSIEGQTSLSLKWSRQWGG